MSCTAGDFSSVRKIAIIGAGSSGLCAIRHIAADPAYAVTAYEQQGRIGGLWNYPEGCEEHNTEQDETSPYFCRMHRNLVVTTPKHHQTFAGAMRRVVKSISPISMQGRDSRTSYPSKQQWTLTSLNLVTSTETNETFDVVMICSGEVNLAVPRQYRKPHIPEISTIDKFCGLVLHSGEYRNRELYKDQNILVIGDSISGDDIICDLRKYAKSLFCVRRRFSTTFSDSSKFPNVYLVSEPLTFTAEGLILNDGTVQVLDTVILCTGYVLDFPFLTPECGVEYSRGRAFPLYRHMINCRYPTMAFIGCIQKFIPVITVAEEQVKYYKAWLNEIFTLPTSEEMMRDCERDYQERIAEGAPEHRVHNMFPFERRLFLYLDTLAWEGKFEPWSEAMRQIWATSAWNLVLEPCTAENYHFEIVDKETYSVCKVNEP